MKQDLVWKEYLSDDERYADIINGVCFGGRQAVSGKQLQPYSPQGHTAVRPADRRKKKERPAGNHGENTRDTVRLVVTGRGCLVAGIETQAEPDYAMPLRIMCYDAGTYWKNASGIRRETRKSPEGLSPGEYLYGFRRESRLYPVITIVLYTGREWDGPRSLHGILDFTGLPEGTESLVPDYGLRLVEIRRLEDTGVFRTDVRKVFDFIRYADDKEKLRELTAGDPYYASMEEDAYEVAAVCTDAAGLLRVRDHHRKKGKIDMCRAIEEMVAEGKAEGIREGKAEGIRQGKAEGKAEGIRGTVSVLRDLDIPVQTILFQIQKEYGLSLEESRRYL